jgi:glycosyltransferase involved in cell wall biosynthesis
MKVLHVINSMATGGAEKLLSDALPKLREEGLCTTLLLLKAKQYPFLAKLKKQQFSFIESLGNTTVYNPLLIFKIIPYIRKFDIVHVHLFPALYWVSLAKILSFSKVTLVFTEHSTSNKRRKFLLTKWIDRLIYSQYQVVVTISTEVKLYLKRHLGRSRVDFRTINNGVSIQNFQTAEKSRRNDFNIPKNHTVILHVARFTRQKDPSTLIRAIQYLEKPATVLFLGEGRERSKMESLVSELDLEKSVQFLGMRDDVPALLKMADIAVLSSNHEGLSLSSLEAMASGTPLIAANVTGLKNLVHGAGILFNHKDEIDLAEKINLLVGDKALYDKTIANGIKRAQKFHLESMVQAHINLYKELCKN